MAESVITALLVAGAESGELERTGYLFLTTEDWLRGGESEKKVRGEGRPNYN